MLDTDPLKIIFVSSFHFGLKLRYAPETSKIRLLLL